MKYKEIPFYFWLSFILGLFFTVFCYFRVLPSIEDDILVKVGIEIIAFLQPFIFLSVLIESLRNLFEKQH